MNNISRKGLELKAIFALVLPSLLLGVASNFSRNIFLVAFFTMFRSFWTIYY